MIDEQRKAVLAGLRAKRARPPYVAIITMIVVVAITVSGMVPGAQLGLLVMWVSGALWGGSVWRWWNARKVLGDVIAVLENQE